MANLNLERRLDGSPFLRYGFSVVSVAIALGASFAVRHYGLRYAELPLLTLAIAFTSWYAGVGPSVLAVLSSCLVFDYFFTDPIFSLDISREDLAYYFIFVAWAVIVASFSAVRRRIENSLRQARDTRTNLLNLTHDSIFVRDMQNIITYWNRGAEEFYGWTAAEVVGKLTTHQLLQTVFPAPLDEIDAELLRTGRWEGELVHIKADGAQAVVASRWSLQRDEQQRPQAILELNKDMTERKRSEIDIRQQANLLNLTHDSIFVRDMQNIITYWNRGAQEFYGWTAAEVVGKMTTHQLLQTVFPAPVDEIDAELLRTGRWEGELVHIKADGTQAVVASRWSLQRDEQQRPEAVLEFNNDITELKREQASLHKKRAAELEAANRELESFAYSVSHDLRAPLRHMVGYSELLQRHASSLLDEKSRRFIQTILDSAKRMGNLIDDLLAFSRIGRAETRKTEVDLEQLVKEVVAETGQDTKGRDIAWKIGALPVCYGDRSMLRVAVVNLISNAVKFTRMRRPAEIEIGCIDGGRNDVEIFVKDNGAGFDMQYQNKLFGVFQRLHLAEEFEGTGIGLAMVQRIIQRHGGTVRAEGAVDRGATFHVSLPKA
ncbi:MAG: sensor histidine kinase [Bradyrhizobium sp.]|nr:sensor histidine kinase [Bradyrhizobium sp.]